MNRRHFIKKASLTTAGGLLMSQLPLHATLNAINSPNRQVILCVIGGLGRQDFAKLFVDDKRNAIKHSGMFIDNVNYNGFVAGHRIAFESILHGRYINEIETGKKPLVESPLFKTTIETSYLISTNRVFLQDNYSSAPNAIHICVDDKSQMVDPIDILVAETASRILIDKKPSLLVAHFMGADAAHGDVDVAEENIKHIGNGLQHIWDTALSNQPNPEKILFIVMPDFGRNSFPNSMANHSGKLGYDHNISNENTKYISVFVTAQNVDIIRNIKESTDILPLVVHFLGI